MMAQAKRSTWQGHSDGIGSCQSLDLLISGADQVIGRDRSQFHGQLSAAQGLELVGVDFKPEA